MSTLIEPGKFLVNDVLNHFNGLENEAQDALIDFFSYLSKFKAFRYFLKTGLGTLPVIGIDASYSLSLSCLLFLYKYGSFPFSSYVVEKIDAAISKINFVDFFVQVLLDELYQVIFFSGCEIGNDNYRKSKEQIFWDNKTTEVIQLILKFRIEQLQSQAKQLHKPPF